jgi:hypothetical protein
VTNESSSSADGQSQVTLSPPPVAPPPVYGVQPPAQQVTCPACFTKVPIGTQYCPQCGSAIPPPTWAPVPPIAPPSKRPVKLIVGIVLIILLLAGVGGFVLYNNAQQQVLQAAKTSDRNAANQSINQLQPTCISVRTDSSTLYGSPGSYSGYRTVYETLGINNPTRFAMDATWDLTLNYPVVHWILSDTESFHMSANGAAHPIFNYRVSGSQLNNLPPNPDLTKFTVALTGTYVVTGSYDTYLLSSNSSYDSSTQSGSGFLASGSSNMPSC